MGSPETSGAELNNLLHLTRGWRSGRRGLRSPGRERGRPAAPVFPEVPPPAHSFPPCPRARAYAYATHLNRGHKQQRPRICPGPLISADQTYFSEVLIDVNFVFRLVPRPLTTAMMASEMPAAIRPYSMAVAPDSSFTKRAIRFFISKTPCTRGWPN